MIKNCLLTISISLFLLNPMYSQNGLDAFLQEIEVNNQELKLYRQDANASTERAGTGLYPSDPEVNFGFLNADPESIGRRIDFSITQRFDFPTAYGFRSEIGKIRREVAELTLKYKTMSIRHQAAELLIKYQAAAKKRVLLEERMILAEQMQKAFDSKLQAGDLSMLDYQQMNLSKLKTERQLAEIQRHEAGLLLEIKQMNAGKTPAAMIPDFPFSLKSEESLLVNLSTISLNHPLYKLAELQIQESVKELSLAKSSRLPKFEAGYMSENVAGESFQGVTAGLSLPLWENASTVKTAKAEKISAELNLTAVSSDLQTKIQLLLQDQYQLEQSVRKYQFILEMTKQDELLTKALESGYINLTDYLYRLDFFFDSKLEFIELQEKYQLAKAADILWLAN